MQTLCFSHLRWDFVYQRPQHLLTRFGDKGRVHFWEEPRFEPMDEPRLNVTVAANGIRVLTPMLPRDFSEDQSVLAQRRLLDGYMFEADVKDFIAWYYTPMALLFSGHLSPSALVYDCMDELSGFQGASPQLLELEHRLFERATVVFAGGASLYASKQAQHHDIHLFTSSIDYKHFAAARSVQADPIAQSHIPHPRIGFYGVLDERLDRELLRDVAAMRPEWHFILIGPVVKIGEEDLPQAANIHYLGMKGYAELPSYLSNWEVAMIPFARNASTRFISPTKTPEYLAGGKPVVSTPIRDVVSPYGEMGLVSVGGTPSEFAECIDKSFTLVTPGWLAKVDSFLAGSSWDRTFDGMWREIMKHIRPHRVYSVPNTRRSVKVEANV